MAARTKDFPLPSTRVELDRLRCPCGKDDCTDTKIYLKANCCRSGNDVFYDRKTGTLTIECARCKKQVLVVKVAATLLEL